MFVLRLALHKRYAHHLFLTALFYVLGIGPTDGAAPKTVISSISTFATKLYSRVSQTGDANLIFSPISLHSMLALAYQGASNATAEALHDILDVPAATATAAQYKAIMQALLVSNIADVEVRLANKIYVKSGYRLRPDFRSTAQKDFSADAEEVDFMDGAKTADVVNQWVSKNTAQRISDLVTADDFDELTRALLLNAVYFKGKWLRAFNVKYTITEKFHRKQSDTVDCHMMRQTAKFDHVVNERLRAQALEIRYRDERFSMIVVLPDEGTELAQLEKNMASQHAEFLRMFLPIRRTLRVFLPKFKIESSLELKNPLIQVGLGPIFSNDANFSSMIERNESLKIDKVIQKAYIEVNEEGAEAAAVTGGVVLMSKSLVRQPARPVFKANRPFLFYITAKLHGNDRTILFMGKVMSPG